MFLFLFLFAVSCGGEGGDDDSTPADDDTAQSDDDADDDIDDDADDDTASESAQVILPPYPFWPNDAYIIDLALMEDLGTAYCAAHPNDASDEDFFYGELPMASFNLFYPNEEEPPAAEPLMGDLYISGYFGGLWLKDALSPDGRGVDPLHLTFEAMAGYTAGQIDLSENGADADVLQAARVHIPLLLFVYGYNRGYLEEILAHPPAGAQPPDDALICRDGQVLDCDSSLLDWPFLDRYQAAITKLREPPNEQWQEMADLTTRAEGFVNQGHLVWQMISLDNLDEAGYQRLVVLSLNFLLASKAAVLGHMTAWADDVPAEGRYSLLTDAGMITWAGSYFMGLASANEPGEFPQLICPED